ncbi:hypothetical protein K7B10_25240 [Streptomyces flavotricini]|uniref:Uncharacterized protein n=1 Tax=Streptomyces flavotricini TaxID=66888 RepID=A0ABS8EA61_9ACTN|nr:hypothetical protein [Streptomyces flavotricini]MCC0098020.1 hypothetical protein [Streptomyces flavotricini]
MELFSRSWGALLEAVDALADADFGRESGCRGWLAHHLDLIAHLPDGPPPPPPEGLARSRALLERIAGAAFPASFTDRDALLAGTGRRAPTPSEQAEPGALAGRLPPVLG